MLIISTIQLTLIMVVCFWNIKLHHQKVSKMTVSCVSHFIISISIIITIINHIIISHIIISQTVLKNTVCGLRRNSINPHG